MKKSVILLSILFCGTFFYQNIALTSTDTPAAARTGAPGESTCKSCHGQFDLNSGPGSISIDFNGGDTTYNPGQTYTVNVTVTQGSLVKFGFQSVVLKDATNTNIGTIAVTNATQTATYNGTVSGGSRKYIAQKTAGTSATTAGSKSWSFDWTAPATDEGNITIYAVGNATNNQGNTGGDYIYTTKQTITPAVANAVKDKNTKPVFALYPNPATEFLNLAIPSKVNETIEISIYDLKGSKVFHSIENPKTDLIEKTINLDESFSKGIYTCQIISESFNKTKTFVVK
jgi:hypothetical protein